MIPMKHLKPTVILLILPFLHTGCGNGLPRHDKRMTITRLDTNRDGKFDVEKHEMPGGSDMDWELTDTDFDGYFDTLTRYGVAKGGSGQTVGSGR